jgi:anti-sigma B factor antagonist
MDIICNLLTNFLIVSLKGSLVAETVPELKKILDDSLRMNRIRVIVDLKDVDFIDTTALAVLVTRSHDFIKKGGGLFLAGLQTHLLHIFESFYLTSFFRIFNDVNEACNNV